LSEGNEDMGKAILAIDFKVLEEALCLPKGYAIVAAEPDLMFKQIQLLLESEDLPCNQEGYPYPRADAMATVEYDREQPHRTYAVEIKVRDY
jgi:hypothetical protein